jgi:ribosome production factor 2
LKKKKIKNISKSKLGTTFGRIHMEKQDLSKLQLRKVKAFKRKSTSPKEEKINKKIKTNDQ